jgi:hypothetical protein
MHPLSEAPPPPPQPQLKNEKEKGKRQGWGGERGERMQECVAVFMFHVSWHVQSYFVSPGGTPGVGL